MTLAQWLERNPKAFKQALTGTSAVQVFIPPNAVEADRWELHHLTDYKVSSAVSGPSYILILTK